MTDHLTDYLAKVIMDALDWRMRSRETGDIAGVNGAEQTLDLYSRMFPLDFERVIKAINGELDAE